MAYDDDIAPADDVQPDAVSQQSAPPAGASARPDFLNDDQAQALGLPPASQFLSDDQANELGLPPASQFLSHEDANALGLPPISKKKGEGYVPTAGREIAHGVLPTAGGFWGAVEGAAWGTAIGNLPGAVIGALLGGFGGSYLASTAQEHILDWLGLNDTEQRAANAKANPLTAELAGFVPAALAMSPGTMATKLSTRLFSGAALGGLEAGQQYVQEGKVDPGKALRAAAFGAIMPEARPWTHQALAKLPLTPKARVLADQWAAESGRNKAQPEVAPEAAPEAPDTSYGEYPPTSGPWGDIPGKPEAANENVRPQPEGYDAYGTYGTTGEAPDPYGPAGSVEPTPAGPPVANTNMRPVPGENFRTGIGPVDEYGQPVAVGPGTGEPQPGRPNQNRTETGTALAEEAKTKAQLKDQGAGSIGMAHEAAPTTPSGQRVPEADAATVAPEGSERDYRKNQPPIEGVFGTTMGQAPVLDPTIAAAMREAVPPQEGAPPPQAAPESPPNVASISQADAARPRRRRRPAPSVPTVENPTGGPPPQPGAFLGEAGLSLPDEAAHVVSQPEVLDHIANAKVIVAKTPNGAGAVKRPDGGYDVSVDPAMPATVTHNGRTISTAAALGMHEIPEAWAVAKAVEDFEQHMGRSPTDAEMAKIYDIMHTRIATPIEKAYVEDHLGPGGFEKYTKVMNGVLRKTEHQEVKPGEVAPGLETYSYTPEQIAKMQGSPETPVNAREAIEQRPAGRTVDDILKDVAGQQRQEVTAPVRNLSARARAKGQSKLADRLETATPEEQKAAKYAMDNAEPRGTVETPEGTTIGAHGAADARVKQRTIDVAKEAFDRFGPDKDYRMAVSAKDIEALKARLQEALDFVKGEHPPYTEQKLNRKGETVSRVVDPMDWPKRDTGNTPAANIWFKAARKLMADENLTPAKIDEFTQLEARLKAGDVQSVRAEKVSEGDRARRRPQGNIEDQPSGAESPEDLLIRAEEEQAALQPGPQPEAPKLSVMEEAKQRGISADQVLKERVATKEAADNPRLHPELQGELNPNAPVPKGYETPTDNTPGKFKDMMTEEEAYREARKYRQEALRKLKEAGATKEEIDAYAAQIDEHYKNTPFDLRPPTAERTKAELEAFERELEQGKSPTGTGKPQSGGAAATPGLPNAMGHRARKEITAEGDFADRIATALNDVRKMDDQSGIEGLWKTARVWMKALPHLLAPRQLYQAVEAGTTNHLSPSLKQFYETHLKPYLDASKEIFRTIKALDPDNKMGIGEDVGDNHILRVAKGDEMNPAMKHVLELQGDPVQGVSGLDVKARGTLLDRKFKVLERDDGKRVVISLPEKTKAGFAGEYTIWDQHNSTHVDDAAFNWKNGGNYIDPQGRKYKMVEALTPEIEANALDRKGKPIQYHQNALWSTLVEHNYLSSVLRHLKVMEAIKNDPDWEHYTTTDSEVAKQRGWQRVKDGPPQFEHIYADDRLRYVLEDYAKRGLNTDALNYIRQFSQATTKLMFWMPIAHMANVGAHWFVERGWKWITPEGYRRLATTSMNAIRSVIDQDHSQHEMAEAGAGRVLPSIVSRPFLENAGREMGMEITRNPTRWDPVFKPIKDVTGWDLRDISDAIYRHSAKAMWAVNDMLLTQAYMERRMEGMSPREAIQHIERHIPNYRMPTTIMGTGPGSRALAKVLGDPTFFAFGPYHAGVFTSYAHVLKDAIQWDHFKKGGVYDSEKQKEAFGNMFAMGLLAFGLYPVLDQLVKHITGNPDAEMHKRGPLAIPNHLIRASQGKEDIMGAARGAMTISPLPATAIETLFNRDWTGRPIVQPGDVMHAAQGNPRAAGRVAIQEVQHAAKGLVSPYSTLMQGIQKGQNPLQTVRDQVIDARNPSVRGAAFEKKAPQIETQKSVQRFKRPPDPVENLFNRMFGY